MISLTAKTAKNTETTASPPFSRSDYSLHRFVGRSLPSTRYGTWIVAEVRGNIEGRSRLVTANLKGEQWVWTRSLVAMLAELDAPNAQADTRREPTKS